MCSLPKPFVLPSVWASSIARREAARLERLVDLLSCGPRRHFGDGWSLSFSLSSLCFRRRPAHILTRSASCDFWRVCPLFVRALKPSFKKASVPRWSSAFVWEGFHMVSKYPWKQKCRYSDGAAQDKWTLTISVQRLWRIPLLIIFSLSLARPVFIYARQNGVGSKWTLQSGFRWQAWTLLMASFILDFAVLLLTGDQWNICIHLMEACWDSFGVNGKRLLGFW